MKSRHANEFSVLLRKYFPDIEALEKLEFRTVKFEQ